MACNVDYGTVVCDDEGCAHDRGLSWVRRIERSWSAESDHGVAEWKTPAALACC